MKPIWIITLVLVMEVLRPDFICLGLVSVSSVKGLGLEDSKVSVSLVTTLSRQDLKKTKMKIEAWKKHSIGGRFYYPRWKNDVFRVEKYLTRKILGLGLGFERSWSRKGWSRSRMVWPRSRMMWPRLHLHHCLVYLHSSHYADVNSFE